MRETKIYAVAGNPVMHSKSPLMFNAAFEALSIDAIYTRLAAKDALDITGCMREVGIAGMNVTSPFKEEMAHHMDWMDEQCGYIGAVNTIVNRNGELHGFNTDWIGVRNAFMRNNVSLQGKKAIVIGAGGAARAAVFALLTEGAQVVISNRTEKKAEIIAHHMGCRSSSLTSMDEEIREAEVLVSCLPRALGRIVDPGLLKPGLVVLDANYGSETILMKDARAKGCTIIDGKEWLLFQGGASFTHFTGGAPPLSLMKEHLYGKGQKDKSNLALVGFMAAGKTTVAGFLGTRLNRLVIDIDREIEEGMGCTIADLFAVKGEYGFRCLEKASIARTGDLSDMVIACGGGAVLDEGNRAVLRKNCHVIWLWAGLESILARTGRNDSRPLLRVSDKSGVDAMLKTRLLLYALSADMIVMTDHRTAEDVAERIEYENNYVV